MVEEDEGRGGGIGNPGGGGTLPSWKIIWKNISKYYSGLIMSDDGSWAGLTRIPSLIFKLKVGICKNCPFLIN